MKAWVGWILLAASLYVTYSGWNNSQPAATVEQLSRTAACEGKTECTVDVERPRTVATSFFGHEYDWKTSEGEITIACARAFIFAGNWACQPR
ncbi:MAG: hypothetical protein K0V04_34735 [Deltaproteobacteria bacterium]|nr:hypothetical protein [Deltaproteobacteria bacterium]